MDYPRPNIDPYAGYPDPGPGMVLHKEPPEPIFWSDPMWYDTMGGNRLEQRGVFRPGKAAAEQIELVKEILAEAGPDPTGHDRGSETLYQACIYGCAAVARWLLLEREPDEGGTVDLSSGPPPWNKLALPLHAAAFEGHLDVVKCLVEDGKIPVDLRDPVAHSTALMRAALGGQEAVMSYLIEKGADPGMNTSCPRIDPVQPESRDVEMSDEDEDYGCDCQETPCDVITAIDYAARCGKLEPLIVLMEGIAERRGLPSTRIHTQELLKEFVQQATIKCAAQSGSLDMVSFLLNEGGYARDLNRKHAVERRDGITEALGYAPKTGTASLAIAQLLLGTILSRNADGTYAKSKNAHLGQSLGDGIVNASSRGHADILRLYATVLRDSCHSTPQGAPEAFKKLLGEEALVRCCQQKSYECLSVLVNEFGVDINTPSPGNSFGTVLNAAIRVDKAELSTMENINFILDRGADLHRGQGSVANGPTPLWMAVRVRNAPIVKKLLAHGGPLEAKDESLLGANRVRVVAKLAYRCPVLLESIDDEPPVQITGQHWVEIDVEGGVTKEWLDRIQVRCPDEDLARDGSGRPLQGPQDEITGEMIDL